jgi:arylformamidase
LAGDLEAHGVRLGERILLKTRNSTRCWGTARFTEDYVGLTSGAAEHLAAHGVRMVGIDYLSIGTMGDEGVLTHRILMKAGIWIVEGLNLSHVRPGTYELICLPLKLIDTEGAPARAVLREPSKAS